MLGQAEIFGDLCLHMPARRLLKKSTIRQERPVDFPKRQEIMLSSKRVRQARKVMLKHQRVELGPSLIRFRPECRAEQNLDIRHRNKPSEARPSRNPSPLHPPCLPHELSAPLSGLLPPAPPLPASLPPVVTLLRHPAAQQLSPRLLSSVLMEHTPALWYDSHNLNWLGVDDVGMESGCNGWENKHQDDTREFG